jgi:hypothetical protein
MSWLSSLFEKPKPSQPTQLGTKSLMDANSAYGNLTRQYGQEAQDYQGQLRGAEGDYLDYLRAPVGSDSQDSMAIGRAREGIDQGARRSAARVALNPSVVASGGQAGAEIGLEHRRLANQANLSQQIAMADVERHRQNQKAIVDYLLSRSGGSKTDLFRAIGGMGGTGSTLLGAGSQLDAQNRQQQGQGMAGLEGLISLLAKG